MSVEELGAALQSYISVPELAQRLSVTTERARQLVNAGEVEAIHTPLGWLVEPHSAQALAERRGTAAARGAHRWSSRS